MVALAAREASMQNETASAVADDLGKDELTNSTLVGPGIPTRESSAGCGSSHSGPPKSEPTLALAAVDKKPTEPIPAVAGIQMRPNTGIAAVPGCKTEDSGRPNKKEVVDLSEKAPAPDQEVGQSQVKLTNHDATVVERKEVGIKLKT